MKQIRYWTTHPIKRPEVWLRKLGLSPADFNFVLDSHEPDYIIATEHIYSDQIAKTLFRRLYSPHRIMLFWAGECISPDLNLFDYAVGYDKTVDGAGRLFRRPVLSLHGDFKHEPLCPWQVDVEKELRAKTGFCNFIYSNPAAHPRRDGLFYDLSRYKRVDALGRHLKNTPSEDTRGAMNFDELSVEMKRHYKFSIAAENAAYVGYTSEKIITSFLAHTVPIYWGNPDIASEFNPDSFINANTLSSEELIDAVRRVDSDDGLWQKMVSTPPMTESQLKNAQVEESAYCSALARVFDLPVDEAKRRPEGYWPDNYRRTFFNGRTCQVTPKNRFLKCLGRETLFAEWVIRKIRPL